jgi:hypothetical protein
VPSGFFSQAESEHLSGILFTNSGTHGTFSRIGYQTGFGNGRFMIQRKGLAYNPDPHARDPSLFHTIWSSRRLLKVGDKGSYFYVILLAFIRCPTDSSPTHSNKVWRTA